MPQGPHVTKLIQRNRAGHKGTFLYEDADWLRAAYVERGLSLREVAVEAECGMRTICRWMKIHGIPTDPTRQPRRRRGVDHPAWKGGQKCSECGRERSRGAKTCLGCRTKPRDENPNWRGDAIGYGAAHERVRAAHGPASLHMCAHCSERQARHWAYDRTDPRERRTLGQRDCGPFSVNPDRYIPLCAACHKRFDLAALHTSDPG